MSKSAQFPQADNLELIYKVFTDLNDSGLNRYSFAEKYHISDRQGAYYLNALCFIGLAEKPGKETVLSERGKIVQMFDEPFRKKVFFLTILENQFICEGYHKCRGLERAKQKETLRIMIEGTYGITDNSTQERRARALLSWFRWMDSQDFRIEEYYNE